MQLHKVTKESGGDIYVEIDENAGDPPAEGLVYVCTRTPWRTSVFGQIESCFWMEESRLRPFKNTKKDQQIRDNIVKARDAGKERSALWYNVAKANKRGE